MPGNSAAVEAEVDACGTMRSTAIAGCDGDDDEPDEPAASGDDSPSPSGLTAGLVADAFETRRLRGALPAGPSSSSRLCRRECRWSVSL